MLVLGGTTNSLAHPAVDVVDQLSTQKDSTKEPARTCFVSWITNNNDIFCNISYVIFDVEQTINTVYVMKICLNK